MVRYVEQSRCINSYQMFSLCHSAAKNDKVKQTQSKRMQKDFALREDGRHYLILHNDPREAHEKLWSPVQWRAARLGPTQARYDQWPQVNKHVSPRDPGWSSCDFSVDCLAFMWPISVDEIGWDRMSMSSYPMSFSLRCWWIHRCSYGFDYPDASVAKTFMAKEPSHSQS